MLHGAINDDTLPRAIFVFNNPAWSLSLEWQFYLIAPIVLFIYRRLSVTLITIAVLTALCIAYDFGVFGIFQQRSLLFASAPFFAVGIASRIAYPKFLASLQNPTIVLALLGAQIPLGWELAPFLVWGCVYATLITDRRNLSPIDGVVIRLTSRMLESRPALFTGARSYSTYLCHMSIISLILYALTTFTIMLSSTQMFLVLFFVAFPLTLIFSCILYAVVERPGIALGNLILIRSTVATSQTIAIMPR